MSPSPLRGQRGSQQYDSAAPQNYQRVPSWGQRQQPPPTHRNFSWGSQADQQQQGYYQPGASSGKASPSGTPTHSRHPSFGSMDATTSAPPIFRNSSSRALQRSSSPALYGSSQPYQVPVSMPTEAQLMAQAQQEWYPSYSTSSGPLQQASTPGMYARGYDGSRPSSARANSGGYGDQESARPISQWATFSHRFVTTTCEMSLEEDFSRSGKRIGILSAKTATLKLGASRRGKRIIRCSGRIGHQH